MRNTFVAVSIMSFVASAFALDVAPARFKAAEAKSHVGEVATVCGKVVDTKVAKYGLVGHGKPVTFDLDQSEPNPVFYFITFGTQDGGPQEALAAYEGKQVCVTGKIDLVPNGATPFIMAGDRSKITVQTGTK